MTYATIKELATQEFLVKKIIRTGLDEGGTRVQESDFIVQKNELELYAENVDFSFHTKNKAEVNSILKQYENKKILAFVEFDHGRAPVTSTLDKVKSIKLVKGMGVYLINAEILRIEKHSITHEGKVYESYDALIDFGINAWLGLSIKEKFEKGDYITLEGIIRLFNVKFLD